MAGENVNYQLERAAGIVKDWSERCATEDQKVVVDDIIEILRRAHQMPRTFSVDDLAESIADWCVTAYGPPLYEFEEPKEEDEGVQSVDAPVRPAPRADRVPLDIVEDAMRADGRANA